MTDLPLTVHVQLGERAYDIQIGSGLLQKALPLLQARDARLSHVVVVADEKVVSVANRLVEQLSSQGIRTSLLTVPSGEASKSIAAAAELWQKLLAEGTDRKSHLVAVGGGVVGDLVGFVAATFARGLTLFQVPTTLLAQVDSSVGGKTGINLPGAKNMVGAFWQPSLVLIDTHVLSTLPDREYFSGLAEVVKYGVILDEALFVDLEQHIDELIARDDATLCQVIARCCQRKADVVEADERETTGLRAVLNYGHTFAHAIESVAGFGQWLHGEAVSMGMVCASRLAEKTGRIPAQVTERQVKLLEALHLPTCLPALDDDRLWQAMGHDKKVEHGRLRFVLPDRLGHVELVDGIDAEIVLRVLADCH